jgi:hypothetical protein
MDILTVDKLKQMEPNTIIASGIGLIIHPWFNQAKSVLEKDGRSTKVKWVAIRGGIHDWAIYHSMDANICPHDYFDCDCHLQASEMFICDYGAKLYDVTKIKEFVPCDDEALQMYRF